MKTDLLRLMKIIDSEYQFTKDSYPELHDSTVDQHVFGVRHSLLHMMKSLGVLAAQLEVCEHGGELNKEVLAALTKKELVNVLKLASHLGVSAEELADHVYSAYGQEEG